MSDGNGRSTASVRSGGDPEVSVLMPMWNSERYLAEAVRSVVAQTGDVRWELLLIDDGSDDASLRIALHFAEEQPERIRILRHPGGENRGRSASRNLGLRHACGRFLTFLDADDVWLPYCLTAQMRVMNVYPEAAMVYCSAERWCHLERPFDEAAARKAWWGENYIPPPVPLTAATGLLPRGALLDWYLQCEAFVPCICSVLMRTDVARAVGGFEEQFRGLYDDQAFHAKVALAYPVVAHEACVARYRQHGDSCCAAGREDVTLQQTGRAQFLKWLERYRRAMVRVGAPSVVEQPQV